MSQEPWWWMIGAIALIGVVFTSFFEIKVVEKEKSPAVTEDFRD